MLHFDSRIVYSAKKTSKNVFRFNQVSAVGLEEKAHIGPKARRPVLVWVLTSQAFVTLGTECFSVSVSSSVEQGVNVSHEVIL